MDSKLISEPHVRRPSGIERYSMIVDDDGDGGDDDGAEIGRLHVCMARA